MNIKKFVMFLGPVRTGHTFIASLLSAHPNVAITLEYQPIKKLMGWKWSRKKLFSNMIKRCKTRKSMEMGGYEYLSSKMQNDISNIEVLGDSIAGFKQGKRISPRTIHELYEKIGIPIKWIIVYRNPYDVVASFQKMNLGSISKNVENFRIITKMTEQLKEIPQIKNNLFSFHIEDFISDPSLWMTDLCNFIGVEAYEDYLKFCMKRTFKKPKKRFNKSLWTQKDLVELRRFNKTIPELERYRNAV